MSSNPVKFGLDFGGVICRKNGGSHAPMEHCFEVLGRFKANFQWEIYVVSQANREITLKWLHEHNFFSITRIEVGDVFFCKNKEEKAEVCDLLGIDRFVDDRAEVLTRLYQAGLPCLQYLYLFSGRQEEIQPYEAFLPHFIRVNEWLEFEQKLLE